MLKLPDPEEISPLYFAWMYSIFSRCKEVYKNQTEIERIKTNFLYEIINLSIFSNEEQFLLKASRILNLSEAVIYLLDIIHFNSNISTSNYFWSDDEDKFLLHLLINSRITQTSMDISFGQRTIRACSNRIKKLKRILKQEGLIDKYIIPDEKRKNLNNEIENEEINYVNKKFYPSYQLISSMQKKKMKKEINQKMKKVRLAKKLKNEKIKENEIQENLKEYSENKSVIPQNRDILLQYCVKRINGEIKGPYSNDEKKFWLNVYLYGNTPFKFFSNILNGPCLNTVKNWIQKSNVPTFDDMCKIENLEKIIRWWYPDQIPPIVNVSIDALKIDEDIYITSQKTVIGVLDDNLIQNSLRKIDINELKRNPKIYTKIWNHNIECNNIVGGIFVVMFCPLSKIKSFPIHIILAPNGSASHIIDQKLKEISEKIRSIGSKPIFVASDSDTHYRDTFKKQFENWKTKFCQNGMNVHGIDLPEEFKCNDGSHILKRARSHLVNHGSLYARQNDQIFRNQGNEKTPHISPNLLIENNEKYMNCWFRKNSLDAMDDFFPMKIFHPTILYEFFKKIDNIDPEERKKFDVIILYLLPMCCLNCIIHSKDENRCIQQKLAYVGMFIMLFYRSWLKIDGIHIYQKKRN